jgi:phytoene desaturase
MKNIAIIGSGFSSLSAACHLAKEGFNVSVFEKNDTVGGRARQLVKKGFTFDIGPSWYWMPDIFEKFFNDFGTSTTTDSTLVPENVSLPGLLKLVAIPSKISL